MSRSYKKTPIIKDRNPYAKNEANRRLRRKQLKLNGGFYKKNYPQYDICDYIFLPKKPIREMEHEEKKRYISK